MEAEESPVSISYLSAFNIITPNDVQRLINYREFIENLNIKLGEQWRSEAQLLQKQIAPKTNLNNRSFSIFNEFLAVFLHQKIEHQYAYCLYSESQVHTKFQQKVAMHFAQTNSYNNPNFESLMLGFIVSAIQAWKKSFQKNTILIATPIPILRPFAALIRQNSTSALFNQTVFTPVMSWNQLILSSFFEKEIQSISLIFQSHIHQLSTTQSLSFFVVNVDEITKQDGQKVRIFSMSIQYYRLIFVLWIIFSFKSKSQLSIEDFSQYFKLILGNNWKNDFENSLKLTKQIIDAEWIHLNRDMSIALRQDSQVIKTFFNKVSTRMQAQWTRTLDLVRQSFMNTKLIENKQFKL